MQLLGGGLAAAGMAGEQLWEWDKAAHAGTHTEDAGDYGSDFVPGEAYNPDRSWLFDLLEGD